VGEQGLLQNLLKQPPLIFPWLHAALLGAHPQNNRSLVSEIFWPLLLGAFDRIQNLGACLSSLTR
jgi:hypothetical protein